MGNPNREKRILSGSMDYARELGSMQVASFGAEHGFPPDAPPGVTRQSPQRYSATSILGV